MNPIRPGSIVVVYLHDPREQIWGVLRSLDATGFQVQGIPLSTFDDWIGEILNSEMPSIGLSTMFYPLLRLEKILLDEDVGAVPSMQGQFRTKVGLTVEEYLGTGGSLPSSEA